jgi:hypothetical protein
LLGLKNVAVVDEEQLEPDCHTPAHSSGRLAYAPLGTVIIGGDRSSS